MHACFDVVLRFHDFSLLCRQVNPMQMEDMITNAKSFCGAGDDETGGGTGEL